MKALKIHMLHEQGITFMDIGKQFGISAKEAMQNWMVVEKAREKSKNRERIIYRKRLNNRSDKSKLAEKVISWNSKA